MKSLLLITTILISFSASAQLSLEHSYSGNWRMELVNIEGEGSKYIGLDNANKNIVFYNLDHSIWKRVNASLPASTTMYTLPTYASKYLFNSDDKVEFLMIGGFGGSTLDIKLINEDGTVLNTITNASWYDLKKAGEDWKLLVHMNGTPQFTDVYALPGKFTGILKTTKEGMASLYPNPLSTVATLHYQLPSDIDNAAIEIFNSSGQRIKSYNISSAFNSIEIQRNDMPTGSYVYKIAAPGYNTSAAFIVN